jgi:hypothetical protein
MIIHCGYCRNALDVDPVWAGRQVGCPHCRQAVPVPALQQPMYAQPMPQPAQAPPQRQPMPVPGMPQPMPAAPEPTQENRFDFESPKTRSKAMSRKNKQFAGAGLFAGVGGAGFVLLLILRMAAIGVRAQNRFERSREQRNMAAPTKTVKPSPSRIKTVKQRAP